MNVRIMSYKAHLGTAFGRTESYHLMARKVEETENREMQINRIDGLRQKKTMRKNLILKVNRQRFKRSLNR
jgi:hypothetical protein